MQQKYVCFILWKTMSRRIFGNRQHQQGLDAEYVLHRSEHHHCQNQDQNTATSEDVFAKTERAHEAVLRELIEVTAEP
jgi:hypothetical protein